MKLQDPATHPAILKACEDLTYDFICEGGNVLPYLQDIFTSGLGSAAKISNMPAEITDRLNNALLQRFTDRVAIKEIPKYFPGVKVSVVNDSPDYIAEGGRRTPQYKKLFKAGMDLSNKSEIFAYQSQGPDSGWIFIHADPSVDLEKMTQFIEVNVPRWEYFSRCDQLPGDDSAEKRKHPLSVLPGSEAAKIPVDDGIPEPELEVHWIMFKGKRLVGIVGKPIIGTDGKSILDRPILDRPNFD